MDLLALPLSWLELLATTALAPAEIARLQTVCRVLRDLLAADQIWRESVPRPAHHALPVSATATVCAKQARCGAGVPAGPLCAQHGFRQQSATRTRGQWPWHRVWRTHLCVECACPGVVALRATTPDGRRIVSPETISVWLCKACYTTVHKVQTQGERAQIGFPRVRAGQGLIAASHWHWLLQQVPPPPKSGKGGGAKRRRR